MLSGKIAVSFQQIISNDLVLNHIHNILNDCPEISPHKKKGKNGHKLTFIKIQYILRDKKTFLAYVNLFYQIIPDLISCLSVSISIL